MSQISQIISTESPFENYWGGGRRCRCSPGDFDGNKYLENSRRLPGGVTACVGSMYFADSEVSVFSDVGEGECGDFRPLGGKKASERLPVLIIG